MAAGPGPGQPSHAVYAPVQRRWSKRHRERNGDNLNGQTTNKVPANIEAIPLRKAAIPETTAETLSAVVPEASEKLDTLRERLDRLEEELLRKARRAEVESIENKVAEILQALATEGIIRNGTANCNEPPRVNLAVGLDRSQTSNTKLSALTGEMTDHTSGMSGMPARFGHINNSQSPDPEAITQEIIEKREKYRDNVQELIRRRIRQFKRQGLCDNDGNKDTDLNDEQRMLIDEDYLMKEYAKREICNCRSSHEVLAKAELLIEEDWLDHIDRLPGNLFCLGAFGDLIPEGAALLSLKKLKGYSKFIGCTLVVLIQIFGPPMVFMSKMTWNWGNVEDKKYEWRCWPLYEEYSHDDMEPCPSGKLPGDVHIFSDWETIASTRVLGLIFIIAFILNGMFVVMSDMQTWKDIYNTFRFLDQKNLSFKGPGGWLLGAGAFVNCWVVFWLCLDMYVVIGASKGPQELLLDALGLLFLYNLDDVGGDLGFVDEDDWPGLRIAWIYRELVHPCPDEEFDEDRLDILGKVCSFFYIGTIFLVMLEFLVIPALVCITPFMDIAPGD